MNYKNILHAPFKNASIWFCSMFDTFQEYIQSIYDEMTDTVIQFAVSTATGDYLDRHGVDVGLERITSETDTSFRNRIKDAYKGTCATKPDIELLVDRVLAQAGFVGTCTVYEWFNKAWLDLLDVAEFTVDLPVEVNYGMFLGYSFYDFEGPSRSYREPFFNSISTILEDMQLEVIKEIVRRKKASGTTYRFSWGGILIDE
jgi:hypothetical protein